jgi:hypothetical protein
MELIKNPEHTDANDAKPAPQVNDISAPAPAAPWQPSQSNAEQKPEPVNDANVAPAPQNTDTEHPAAHENKPADRPKPINPPKIHKHHGSGGAIFAAVVIILALGAMFTYAYLRSNNIAVF